MTIKVIVIGIGQAGLRFIRACICVSSASVRLDVIAAVDVRAERRAGVERLGLPWHPSVADAAAAGVTADIAIVTVPEIDHFDVLCELRRCFPKLRRILCEKPLVANGREADALGRIFADDEVSINFVERLSPIVEEFRRFVDERGRRIVRAHCMWGKYRIKDARPTPGVVDVELAHPVDLVLALANVPVGTSFAIASVVATKSDVSTGCTGDLPLDTVDLVLTFANGPQVLVSTSLLWAKRRRRLELLLADGDGIVSEMAVLVFDDPVWDVDRLEIFDTRSRPGSPSLIHALKIDKDDWPSDQFTIGKVCRFLEANLADLAGQTRNLPRLRQGAYVQEILEAVKSAAQDVAVPLRCFAGMDASSAAPETPSRVDFLSRLKNGEPISPEEFVWDHEF